MGWGENDRGVSFTFGAEVAAKFLHKHDFDLICRAHQVVEDGYEFFAKRQLVTLFSAPNYCGEFDNAGAMMSVDETLMCSFQILKVSSFPFSRKRNEFVKILMFFFYYFAVQLLFHEKNGKIGKRKIFVKTQRFHEKNWLVFRFNFLQIFLRV